MNKREIPCYALSVKVPESHNEGGLCALLIGNAIVEGGQTSELYIWREPGSMFEEIPEGLKEGQVETRESFYNDFKTLGSFKKTLYTLGMIGFQTLHSGQKNLDVGKIISLLE